MKFGLGLLGMTLLVAGCGIEGDPNLADDPSYFGQVDSKTETTQCVEPFSFSLVQTANSGISPALTFSSTTTKIFDASSTAGDVRCNEVRNHLSGSTIKRAGTQSTAKVSVEISFMLSDAERKQMAHGLSVNVSPARASIEYLDGSLEGKTFGVDLLCPKNFSVVCETQTIDGQKECTSYKAGYSNQTCAIRATGLPFVFSDNRVTKIDMSGELNLSSRSGVISILNIAWHGLY